MKVSLKWLSKYVSLPSNLQEFCDRLDLTGTGVEGVEKLGSAYDKVVVGHVLTCDEHPNSDHMHIVSVDVGADEPLQIVCGAPNIAAGIKVPVACIGAVLPGNFKIKKSKLRGVASCGMCCSAKELGQGTDHEGIWVLPNDAKTGMPIAEYLGLADTVLDLEITPNRPDSLSIAGFAREVAAIYGKPWHDPLPEMASKFEVSSESPANVSVTVNDYTRCPRYAACAVTGVKIAESPQWLVQRLNAIGQRSINNVVDVTNYILFLIGQPLHAFDLDKLKNAEGCANVVVRPANAGEKLETLDGQVRTLTEDMTVISTPEAGAVALAGVMGGAMSEVTEATTNILLECATFEPGRTSRTSRNLGLFSESSMRYERGVDANGIDERLKAAAALIAEVSGGSIVPVSGCDTGFADVYETIPQPKQLAFRVQRFQKMMGAKIPCEFIESTLTRLGCSVSSASAANAAGQDTLQVEAPTFRPDLEREIDLYEEVLRIWGMDKIESTLPEGRGRIGSRSREEVVLRKIHSCLNACGINETMTYSFAAEGDLEKLRMLSDGLGDAVELINPLNAQQAHMRRTIIPGLLQSVAHNQAHGVANIQLYEAGSVFAGKQGCLKPKERQKLACVMAGSMSSEGWNNKPNAFDFFDGKGVLEALAEKLALPKVRFRALEAESAPHLQPGRAAEILTGGTQLGWVGELHPLAVEAFDATGPVVAFELDVKALISAARSCGEFVDVPTFPSVCRDLALVVPDDVSHEHLVRCIKSAGGKLLESVRLFDVYRDKIRIGANKKSMAFALEYRAADRTLKSEEVDRAHAKVIKKVCAACGAEVRS